MRHVDTPTLLDECLARRRAGEEVADLLARYGDQVAQLAPMLAAADRLQGLSTQRLTEAQRAATRATLRRMLVSQPTVQRTWWPDWHRILAPARGFALAGIAAMLLFVVLAATAVAASQPGEPAYRLRVLAERAPALLQIGPQARAHTELDVAERRLADLGSYLASAGRVEPIALDALLSGQEIAARQASGLPDEAQRIAVAARITAHADRLAELAAQAADSPAETALQTAARQAYALAERVRLGWSAPDHGEPGTGPSATATPSPTPLTTPEPRATMEDRPTATLPPSPIFTATVTAPATSGPTMGARSTARPEHADRTPLPPEGMHGSGSRPTSWAETATAVATPSTALPPTQARPTHEVRTPSPVATGQPQPPQEPPTGGPTRPGGGDAQPSATPGARATAHAETATVAVPTATPPPPPTVGAQQPNPTQELPASSPTRPGGGDSQPSATPGARATAHVETATVQPPHAPPGPRR